MGDAVKYYAIVGVWPHTPEPFRPCPSGYYVSMGKSMRRYGVI